MQHTVLPTDAENLRAANEETTPFYNKVNGFCARIVPFNSFREQSQQHQLLALEGFRMVKATVCFFERTSETLPSGTKDVIWL